VAGGVETDASMNCSIGDSCQTACYPIIKKLG
jgi:hypothetical protein